MSPEIRMRPVGGGLFGDSRKPRQQGAAQSFAISSHEHRAEHERPTTHLDAVEEYRTHHGHYAAQGITLEAHVNSYFINESAVDPTAEQLAAVKEESERLSEAWRSGEVADPFAPDESR